MTELDTAVDVALEHVAWLRRHGRRHCTTDAMRAIGRPELARGRRVGACDIRTAALAAAWLELPIRG